MKFSAIPTMLSMVPSLFRRTTLRDLETIKRIVRQSFPTVSQVNTDTVARWMHHDPSVLLIDVRSSDEFNVSNLKGAVNVQSAADISQSIAQRNPSKAVLYCSVGFRSSKLAHALAQQGLPGVLNLEGSIFQWANEGRPLYRGELPVEKVHPFGKRWAGLLKPGLASDL